MAKKKGIKPPNLDEDFRSNPIANASFLIDGFKVSISHEMSKNRLLKMIYVNGWQKGKWFLDTESEENKRFAYSFSRYVYSKNFRESMLKLYKGAEKRERRKDLEERKETRTFITSVKVKSIVKQWCDREINKSVVLVDDEGNTIFKYK